LFIYVMVVFLLRGVTAQGVHMPINIACKHSALFAEAHCHHEGGSL